MRDSFQTAYQETIRFAGERHGKQTIEASNSSYMVHLANVAMEVWMASAHTSDFDLEFGVRVALLHDVIEDTTTTFEEVEQRFGTEIAEAVLALTKDESLSPKSQIPDSLKRIKKHRKEVWAVKLADRISNMQQPPSTWNGDKKREYLKTAGVIHSELQGGNAYLEQRLKYKIDEYQAYL